MAYKNLNIPATLVHTVDGKKYTLNGKLLSINESSKTCSMQFGEEITNNVPLNEVYLNEAFLDDIKALGHKVADKAKKAWKKITDVVKTVAGFILPVDENGDEIPEFANIPVNIACVDLPNSICYAPGDATVEACEEMGSTPVQKYDAETVFSKAEADDKKEIETYWTRVMQDYGESDRTIEESVKYVNENFYHENQYIKHLNEQFASAKDHHLNEYEVAMESLDKIYGPQLNTAELIDRVTSSLMHQLNPISNEDARAVLIWGAPGIGKTAVIKQAAKELRELYNLNFDTAVVCCGGLKQDDFELPDTIKNAFGDKQVISVPKTWLPVFKHNGLTEDEIAEMDEYYNSGAFLKRIKGEGFSGRKVTREIENGQSETKDQLQLNKDQDAKFDGGIIFFDEFGRIRNLKTMDTMLTICGDRRYMDMELASKWVQVAASNRLTDDMKSEADRDFWGVWDQAKFQRFYPYTYVPTKQEWLDWAREADENGYQNVDELIVAFIEKAPDGVWYDAIKLGSRDEYFKGKDNTHPDTLFKNAVDKIGTSEMSIEDIKTIGQYISNPGKSLINLEKTTWSGRTWDAMIAKKMLSVLKNEFFYGEPDKYEACFAETTRTRKIDGGLHTQKYTVKNLSMSNLKKELDSIPDVVWGRKTQGKNIKCDPKGELRLHDRLGFFIGWVGQIIADTTGENNLPSKVWNKYQNSRDILDPKNKENIWMHGEFKSSKEKEEDNLFFVSAGEYNKVNSCSWKANPELVDQVCQELWNGFDNYITTKNIASDLKTYISAKNKNNLNNPAFVDKYDDMYSLKLINGVTNKPFNVPIIFNNVSPEVAQDIAAILEYSKTARYLANIALYFVKMSYQIHNNNPAHFLLGDINDLAKNGADTLENKCKARMNETEEYRNFIKNDPSTPFIIWEPALTILKSYYQLS